MSSRPKWISEDHVKGLPSHLDASGSTAGRILLRRIAELLPKHPNRSERAVALRAAQQKAAAKQAAAAAPATSAKPSKKDKKAKKGR